MKVKRLWWFMLVNNAAVLCLFGYTLISKGQIILGSFFPFEGWLFQETASRTIAGSIPFIFSFGFLLWKVATMSEPVEVNTLDQQELPSQV